MSKITQKAAIIAALRARGSTEAPSRSRKYAVLNLKTPGPGKYFIGKSGALRVGATVGGSVPVSDKFRSALLVEGGYYGAPQ